MNFAHGANGAAMGVFPAKYYLASLKHTQREHHNITFWRPENAGYTWHLPAAGLYTAEQVNASLDYYNNGDSTIAVLASAVERLGRENVEGNGRFVVPNTLENWKAMMAAVISAPAKKPKFPAKKGKI